eukprot:scaffold5501_cov54-Cylindrotheca_fusiformis.AAC.1
MADDNTNNTNHSETSSSSSSSSTMMSKEEKEWLNRASKALVVETDYKKMLNAMSDPVFIM